MSFSLPPLARRIVAFRSVKSKQISLIEQVCILPIGGGLWFPVRNLTKSLEALEKRFSEVAKVLKSTKDSLEAETEYINKEIDRIGFYTETTLLKDPATGEYRIVDMKELVDFRLGKDRKVVANAKPKSRKEVFGNLLIETRKPSSGNQQSKKKKNSNNN